MVESGHKTVAIIGNDKHTPIANGKPGHVDGSIAVEVEVGGA